MNQPLHPSANNPSESGFEESLAASNTKIYLHAHNLPNIVATAESQSLFNLAPILSQPIDLDVHHGGAAPETLKAFRELSSELRSMVWETSLPPGGRLVIAKKIRSQTIDDERKFIAKVALRISYQSGSSVLNTTFPCYEAIKAISKHLTPFSVPGSDIPGFGWHRRYPSFSWRSCLAELPR